MQNQMDQETEINLCYKGIPCRINKVPPRNGKKNFLIDVTGQIAWNIPWTEEPVGLQSLGSQS